LLLYSVPLSAVYQIEYNIYSRQNDPTATKSVNSKIYNTKFKNGVAGKTV